jgi:hypothetical protein
LSAAALNHFRENLSFKAIAARICRISRHLTAGTALHIF